ncbi:glycosyltransferase [Cenarchaeum symbiosum A]|uniref:Glycosyltransferase n=1 Tax=Cenarchaeum symbiosum (strain A) TaxID=414004 RepID=A0RWB7_CENSY|nr:glycosyltransferase [Cenarchaeum symbiosum A]
MKFLFIAPRYTGGIGGHAARLAAGLRGINIEVDLLHAPHLNAAGLRNPSFALSSAITALFRRKQYGIVHAFNVPSAPAMRCARGIVRVLSVHGEYARQVGALHAGAAARAAGAAESLAFRWADGLVTDSRAVQESYAASGASFEVLPNPLDTIQLEKIGRPEKVPGQVAYVGRDSYEKGIDILRGIEGNIRGTAVYCTGMPWAEAMQKLAESELLVLPSRMESSPQVIKEAFYLGVPVVAASVGGVPEMVIDGENGVLVPPEDPGALLNAVNDVLDDSKWAAKLARAGRESAREYTWKEVLPKYIRFYRDLVEPKCDFRSPSSSSIE